MKSAVLVTIVGCAALRERVRRSASGHRQGGGRRRTERDRVASRHPREPRTVQSRSANRRDGCRVSENARHRRDDRRRAHRCRRNPARRQTRQGRGAARRHGCAAGRRRNGAAVCVDRDQPISRPGRRRDARVRSRQPRCDPDGCREGARGRSRATARHGQVHLPTGRRRGAAGRRRRRQDDGRGRRAEESGRRCDLRSARDADRRRPDRWRCGRLARWRVRNVSKS